MDEILRLQRELAEVQQTSATLRLSEPNIIEIVSKLIQAGKVQLIFTQNGKEFITPKQLLSEIEDEVLSHRGRVNLADLQPILNVDLSHIERAAATLLEKDSTIRPLNGQLITDWYLDSLAEQIDVSLQQAGRLSVSDLAVEFEFATDFVTDLITRHLGRTIHGQFAQGTLYTPAYVTRHAAQMRGALLALVQPTALDELAETHKLNSALLHGTLAELVESRQVAGSLHAGSGFVPAVFEAVQSRAVDSFYAANGYVEYEMLAKLQIANPRKHLRARYPGGLELEGCYAAVSCVQQVEGQLDECATSPLPAPPANTVLPPPPAADAPAPGASKAAAAGGAAASAVACGCVLELSDVLPAHLTAADGAAILARCGGAFAKGSVRLLGGELLVSKALLERGAALVGAREEARARELAAAGGLVPTVIATGGAAGSGNGGAEEGDEEEEEEAVIISTGLPKGKAGGKGAAAAQGDAAAASGAAAAKGKRGGGGGGKSKKGQRRGRGGDSSGSEADGGDDGDGGFEELLPRAGGRARASKAGGGGGGAKGKGGSKKGEVDAGPAAGGGGGGGGGGGARGEAAADEQRNLAAFLKAELGLEPAHAALVAVELLPLLFEARAKAARELASAGAGAARKRQQELQAAAQEEGVRLQLLARAAAALEADEAAGLGEADVALLCRAILAERGCAAAALLIESELLHQRGPDAAGARGLATADAATRKAALSRLRDGAHKGTLERLWAAAAASAKGPQPSAATLGAFNALYKEGCEACSYLYPAADKKREKALLANTRASLRASLEEGAEPSAVALQAIESLFCELCGLLVLATKETARPLLKALGAMTSLPPRAIESVRELVECTAQSDREAADGGEMERLMAAVKAVALSKEARSVGGGEAD